MDVIGIKQKQKKIKLIQLQPRSWVQNSVRKYHFKIVQGWAEIKGVSPFITN